MPFIEQYPESPPVAYPTELQQELELPSGEFLWMRPIVPGDAAVLSAEFDAADDATRNARFFTASFDLTPLRLRYLTELDYTSHLALVVMTGGGDESEGVAIGRYVARTPTEVEAAVVVKPEFRRRGIARLLVEHLTAAAGRAGYSRVFASYLVDNIAAGGLLNDLGFSRGALQGGVVTDASRSLIADPATIGSA